VLGLESRRVDEHELRVARAHDSADTMAGRLRFARGDRHPRADEPVDERRLADVRAADNCDEAAPEIFGPAISHGVMRRTAR
jgi:hypothetical protein